MAAVKDDTGNLDLREFRKQVDKQVSAIDRKVVSLDNEMRKRVEAVEARQAAIEARLLTQEHLLMDVQVEVQGVRKDAQKAYVELAAKSDKILEVLQPKVVLPPEEPKS